MEKIKVYLYTGQDTIREIVHSVLGQIPSIDIIDEIYLNRITPSLVESKSPVIAILDIGGDGDSWVDMTRQLREESPLVAVLLLTDNDSDDLRYTALKSGANAFLTYDRVPDKLNKTVKELTFDQLPIIRTLLRPYVASFTLDEFHDFSSKENGIQQPDIRLSFQQRTLLQYVENRHSVQQLVSNLGISQNSIREHLERIREKLVEIDDYLRPVLQPTPVPEVPEEIEIYEEKKNEAPKATKIARKLPLKLKQVSLNKITPVLTTYTRRLYKSIFRPTVSRVIILVIVMIIGFFLSIHLLPGHNMYVVSSESMKPTINIGDIIVTRSLDDQSINKLAPGNIITFSHGKNTVTHRLLSINGDQLTTKGDAAEESDPWSITLSEVKDVYLFRIPYLGYIPQLAKEKIGWFLIIVLPAILLVALLVKDIIKEALRNDKPATEKQGGSAI